MRGLIFVSLFVLVVGCSTERVVPPAPTPAESSASSAAPAAPELPMTSSHTEPREPREPREGRDPFEPAAIVVAPPPPDKDADVRKRKSKRFGVEELKLIGIVSGAEAPRAMLVDPRGKGWVVTRGDLIGRPEVLHDSGGDHRVSWRVDRIRESDVILVREDATHSIAPPSSTRVLALHRDPVISDDAELDD